VSRNYLREALKPGDVISYFDMCAEEGTSLRRGMNYQLRHRTTVILMSTRPGAPYRDRVQENGRVLIYEGHDNPRPPDGKKPKEVDQEERNPDGSFTQNGQFANAATEYKQGSRGPEVVKVYEKIKTGIWVYNGQFLLADVWRENSEGRGVFKFRLELAESGELPSTGKMEIEQTRVIPTAVKLEVWRRDEGKCVKCGAKDNLHFDHIIPFSKGGTSMDATNIQLLCVRHNLEKRDRIE
jgi:HNH endonuclease